MVVAIRSYEINRIHSVLVKLDSLGFDADDVLIQFYDGRLDTPEKTHAYNLVVGIYGNTKMEITDSVKSELETYVKGINADSYVEYPQTPTPTVNVVLFL